MSVLEDPSGLLQYNGITFPGSTSSDLRIQPIPDASGRTVKYSVFTITARAEWSALPGQSTSAWESDVADIRRKLSHMGGSLTYNNKGIGQLNVNSGTSGARDVAWGPKPQELAFRLLGAGRAFAITWQVQVAIPDCSQAAFGGRLMEYNWSVSYGVDYAGYTTRTVSGYFAIPAGRTGNGRQLADTPDAYFALIEPPKIRGFRRTYGPRKIDDSKTRCDFSFVDTEMGINFPPEWVVDLKASQTVQSTAAGLAKWSATISAEYELAKNAPDAWSPWKHFIGVLVKDRVDAIKAGVANKKSIVPLSLSMSEPEIYGRRKAAFSFSFTFAQPLKEIASSTGLWRPVPGSDWNRWAQSLQTSALNPFGFAKLALSISDDRIVDLCDGTGPAAISGGAGVGGLQQPRTPNQAEQQTIQETISPTPLPESSWIDWSCSIFLEVDSGTGSVRTLPVETPKATDTPLKTVSPADARDFIIKAAEMRRTQKTSDASYGTGSSSGNGGSGGSGTEIKATDSQSQATRRSAPAAYLYLVGSAVRHGFTIPCPTLDKVNGVECVEANRLDSGEGFQISNERNAGGAAIFRASWKIRYALAAVPQGDLPVPPNPMLNQ